MDEIINQEGYTKELWDFRTHFTIHCPKCDKRTLFYNEATMGFLKGRISCSSCGFFKEFDENSSYSISTLEGTIIESKIVMANQKGIKLLLWYSANFKGNSFWVYNENHLRFLYDFIKAKHRTRSQTELKNKSIGSRLPKWMTSAANREDIRKLIENML